MQHRQPWLAVYFYSPASDDAFTPAMKDNADALSLSPDDAEPMGLFIVNWSGDQSSAGYVESVQIGVRLNIGLKLRLSIPCDGHDGQFQAVESSLKT